MAVLVFVVVQSSVHGSDVDPKLNINIVQDATSLGL